MAIAFDNSSSAVSYTVSHTIAGAGNDRILIAFYQGAHNTLAGARMTGCTYNGVSADGVVYTDSNRYGNYYSVSAYYWLESSLPASAGTYNCVATSSGTWNYGGIVASFTGVNQIAPDIVGAYDNEPLGTDNSTVTITTPAINSVVCDAGGHWLSTVGTISAESGQTVLDTISINGQADLGVGYEAFATISTAIQEWANTNTMQAWTATAFAFGPSGGAVTPQYNMLGCNF